MMYVVYNIESTMHVKSFETEAGAKRSRTCMNRKAGAVKFAYARADVYNEQIVGYKTVRSLVGGQEVTIRTNTPRSCDPSSELYWSM